MAAMVRAAGRKSPQTIQEEEYDLPYHWFQIRNIERSYKLKSRLALQMARLAPESRVLDIGCGDGRFTADIPAKQIVGIDYSRRALRFAHCLAPKAFYIQASAHQLPFKDNCFDLVFCLDLLEHLPDEVEKRCCEEVARVLKPEGRFVLSVPSQTRRVARKHHRHYDLTMLNERLKGLFKKVRFQGQDIDLRFPGFHKLLNAPLSWRLFRFTIRPCSPRWAIKLLACAEK